MAIMRFLVDGYNVTKRDPATAGLPLAGQREALVARLAVRGRDLLGPGEIVVVFDGVTGGGAGSRRGIVEVRYARGESADDVLVRLAGAGTCVVSSDDEVARRASAAGARVLATDTCFEARKPKRRGRGHPVSGGGLPRGAKEITRELKELWVDREE